MELKKFTRLSMLISLSIILSLLESYIPILNGVIPGLKLGLANAVILLVLYSYGVKDAFYVSIIRIILVGMLRTGLFNTTFFFSLGGAFFSLTIMSLVYHSPLSIVGTSMLGSIFHTIGQILVASLFLQNHLLLRTLPWLILLSMPTGIFIGYLTKEILTHRKKIEKNF